MFQTELTSLLITLFMLLGLSQAALANNASTADTSLRPGDWSVTIYSRPNWQGRPETFQWNYLTDEQCQDIGFDYILMPVNSVKKRGFPCCVLFRTYCPPRNSSSNLGGIPFSLSQRFYEDIADFTPFGWAGGIARSIICYGNEVCKPLRHDRHFSDDTPMKRNLHPFWVDYRDVELNVVQELKRQKEEKKEGGY